MKYFAIFFLLTVFAFTFSVSANADLVKLIVIEKEFVPYGDILQYTITRTQIRQTGGEELQTRIINKSTGMASDWSPITLESSRDTVITSKIIGQPFDKKGDYILEVKYTEQSRGTYIFAHFQLVTDADKTKSEGQSHFLSPRQQLYANIPFKDITCKDGLQLLKKSYNAPACVKPETVNKLLLRGWALDLSAISSFEECESAGNPVMQSYPRQCKTSDGQNFVEQIN